MQRLDKSDIIKDADRLDTSDGFTGNNGNNNQEKIDVIKHETAQIDPLKQSKNTGVSVSNPSYPSYPSAFTPKCYRCDCSDYNTKDANMIVIV